MQRRRRYRRRELLLGATGLAVVIALLSPSGATAAPADGPRESQVQIRTTSPGLQRGNVKISVARGTAATESARPAALPNRFNVLQMNLCNSGVADCWDQNQGQAVPEAVNKIVLYAPSVVTLNEICLSDVDETSPLFNAMVDQWTSSSWVLSFFYPVVNADDPPAPVTCEDGRGQFGNAIIMRVRAEDWNGATAWAGHYPDEIQYPGANRRNFICVQANTSYNACVTHLNADSQFYAFEQCQYLMDGVIPTFVWNGSEPDLPSVVGGDFNLGFDISLPWSVPLCTPNGWNHEVDGGVQYVLATDDFTFDVSLVLPMEHTDHPALLVSLLSP